jgi:ferritin-like metal-binding protein YciE
MRSLKHLFDDTIKAIYDAEKQFGRATPEIILATQDPNLKATMEDHRVLAKGQVDRLAKIAEIRGFDPTEGRSLAAEGLVEEVKEKITDEESGPTRDAAIVLCAQKAEHYEICSYGTLIEWANVLGFEEIVELLHDTLNEEKTEDFLLTSASRRINRNSNRLAS